MSIQETRPSQAKPSRARTLKGSSRKGARQAGVAAQDKAALQRRERVVRLASPLFLKKGYDNVSIDEIIGVVGGSKATIYSWFGGKEGLFHAVVRQKCNAVTLAIDIDPKGSMEQQLTRIGRSFLANVLSPPIMEFHRLMVSIGRTFPDAGRLFFKSGPVSAYGIVAAWIEKQQRDGTLAREDPYRLAVLFLDMLIGEHQLGWLTSMPRAAQRKEIDETVRVAVKIFLRGAAA